MWINDIYVTWSYNVWNSKWTCVYIFIMTLFVIMWNDGWMVIYILACHHGGKKFNCLVWHLIHALKPTSDMCLGVNKLVKATLNVKKIIVSLFWVKKEFEWKKWSIIFHKYVDNIVLEHLV